MSYNKLRLLGLIAFILPNFAFSEDGKPELCANGQYVISIAEVEPLREKAVDALDSVTPKDLEIKKENEHVILIDSTDASDKPALTEYNEKTDLCTKLEKKYREQMRAKRAGDDTIVRRYRCSCNGIMFATDTFPNDPYFSVEWGLHQSSGYDMNLPQAWDLSRGSDSVAVAVIDTGVDYNHQDLAANIWTNPGEIAGNGIDDDRNGVVDDVHGFNAINGSGNPMDDNGHGTHASGTIGARGNNGIGVTGVAWNVKIIPVKYLSSTGSGSLYDAITAIDYVTNLKNRGVNIILSSNSWGGKGYYAPLYDAIGRARNAGLLFVAAAGNSSENNDGGDPAYPASYPLENIISVAALAQDGSLASFSCYGANSVHIGAPGVQIGSTYPGNRYVYMSGTSMATPHISGLLALLKSVAPGLSGPQMRSLLLQQSDVFPGLSNVVNGGRAANAFKLLTAAAANPPPSAPTPTPPPPTPTPTPTVPPTPTPTPRPTPANYSIRGVTQLSNAALGGARVDLYVSGSLVASRTSSGSGEFYFDTVQAGAPYKLVTRLGSYRFPEVNSTLNGDAFHYVNVVSGQPHVTVKVISLEGNPVAGVTIDGGAYGALVTNASGIADFQIPYSDDYALLLTSNDYTLKTSQLAGRVYGSIDRLVVAELK